MRRRRKRPTLSPWPLPELEIRRLLVRDGWDVRATIAAAKSSASGSWVESFSVCMDCGALVVAEHQRQLCAPCGDRCQLEIACG
jgi:hypothetical protein